MKSGKERVEKLKRSEDEEEEESMKEAVILKSMGNCDDVNDVKPLATIHKLGDRVVKERAPVLDSKAVKRETDRPSVMGALDHSRQQTGTYKPITKESKQAYEEILDQIVKMIPDQSHDFITDCAYECIRVLKEESQTENRKKEEMSRIVRMSDAQYYRLKSKVLEINDFHQGNEQNEKEVEKTINLEFKEEKRDTQMEIEYETTNVEEKDDNLIEESVDRRVKSYDRSSISKIVAKSRKAHTQDLETTILSILKLKNEVDIQNKLFELEDELETDLLIEIYQKRSLLFYGYYMDTFKDNRDQLVELISEIGGNNAELEELVRHYRSGVNEMVKMNERTPKQRIEAMKLIEMAQMTKNLISLKPKQESMISFSAAPLKLPKNSVRIAEKGYEEIMIPAHSTEFDSNEKIVKINVIPAYFRNVFTDLKSFNRVQSKVFDFAFKSNKNMLLCAPTGAGKTVVAILTILGLMESYRDSVTQLIDLSKFKVVYLAPMKALVAEIVSTLNFRLNYLGVQAAEFTGDVHMTMSEFEEATVIVSTPEKWDVLSRKTLERQFSDKLKLLIVDEIHLLGDSRGPVIETVIVRTLRQASARIVGLSATLPNFEDVARFLDVDFASGLFYFNNGYRPVPLSQTYIGISETSGVKKMSLMNEILFKKVIERVKDFQILIFTHSRKETVRTANELKETAFAENIDEVFVSANSKAIIDGVKNSIDNPDLQKVISSGIAFHHAGLSRSDRRYVEDLFANGHISVLVSTATLAWGVNLPAHTVIIKNTQVYSPVQGNWVGLSVQNLMQMLGRAGRPMYDREGEGIIITSTPEMRRYIGYLNEQEPIESSLLASLPEALNAEVVLGHLRNLKQGCEWLTRTYLYQRLRHSPRVYGLTDNSRLTEFMINAVHTAACEIESVGLLAYDRESGAFETTAEGRIASFFYIKPENMKIYAKALHFDISEIDLLHVFSSSLEFKNIAIRDEEKVELSRFYSSVPIPIKSPIDDARSKINILLQCYISRVDLEGYALGCDLKFVSENAQRIFRAFFELSVLKQSGACQLILDFSKMTERRVWKELFPLRQCIDLPEKSLQRIEQQEHLSFEHFKTLSVTQISNIVKNESVASEIHDVLLKYPNLETNVFVQILSRTLIKVNLNYIARFEWDNALHGSKLMFRVLVLDVDQEKLMYQQPFYIYRSECQHFKEEKTIEFTLLIAEPLPPHYFIKVVSESWLCCETSLPIFFKEVCLPTKFPVCRELEVIGNEQADVELEKWKMSLGIKVLTSLQAQVINSFFNSFNNVFLGAVRNSGKFEMALLSMVGIYAQNKSVKSVILFSSAIEIGFKVERIKSMAAKLGIDCGVLTGNLQIDIGILSTSQVIVATCKQFEKLTRNYKKRPQLRQVRLVIATDISSISTCAAYEVVLSRIRLIFGVLEQKWRLIALSSPISNYSTVCDWLGVEPEYAFNFHKSIRNRALTLHIHSNDAIQTDNFYQTTAKKLVSIITEINEALLFVVESGDSARVFASMLLKELLVESENPFLLSAEQTLTLLKWKDSFEDVFNSSFIEFGLAYIHKGSSIEELKLIRDLVVRKELKAIVSAADGLNSLFQLDFVNCVLIDAAKLSIHDLSYVSGLLNYADANDVKAKSNLTVFVHEWEKEQFARSFSEPEIVESQLFAEFIDVLNVEVSSGAISKKEECVDWLTWTLFYRRLAQNPNYYNLASNDPLELSNYISELVDVGVTDLEQSKCVEVSENEISAENNGVIASFYDLRVATMDSIYKSIDEHFTWSTLIHVIASSREFENMKLNRNQLRHFEELNSKVPVRVPQHNKNSFYFKVFIELQSYLSRLAISNEMELELHDTILPEVLKMINGFVDCSSALMMLKPAILAMKFNQMLAQRIWHNESTLKQLPFFDEKTIEKAKQFGVDTIEDFLYMEDEERNNLLSDFGETEKVEIARFANSFPNFQINAKLVDEKSEYFENEEIKMEVEVERDNADEPIQPICKMGLTVSAEEYWWLLVADRVANKLFYVKKIQIDKQFKKEIVINSAIVGQFDLTVLLVSDSCLGFDVEKSGLKMNIIN